MNALDRSDSSACTPALVLGGGGARAAYQAGVLRYVGESFPDATFPILTGVSAGSINAAQLADGASSLASATERLERHWRELTPDRVYESRSVWTLAREFLRSSPGPQQSLFSTYPLRAFLRHRLRTDLDGHLIGVQENLDSGRLKALAMSTSNYSTLQTVTWVQGSSIEDWERPNRVGTETQLTLDHVLASSSLPLLFPAVRIGPAWYGDGGLRMLDPLAPAIHLGADGLFVISTRYERTQAEADVPQMPGYPSPFQIAGILANLLMLDVLEHDAEVLRRINRLVRALGGDPEQRFRPIDLLVIRPSEDLGALANAYQQDVGRAMGPVLSTLLSDDGSLPDGISMLMFVPRYVDRLLTLGYEDAHARHDDIAAFLERNPAMAGQ